MICPHLSFDEINAWIAAMPTVDLHNALVLNGWAMQDLTDAARRTGRATDQYTAALDQLLNFLKGLAARPDGDDRA